MDLSDQIIKVREQKGITQAEVARTLDMVQSNYARLEKRGNKLTLEQLERIADALGVTVFELLNKEEDAQTERIQYLESKNAELKERLKETIPLRSELESFEKQLKVYEEMFRQTKQRNREVREWASDVVASLEAGNPDTVEKLVRFIKSVYLSDDEPNQKADSK